MDQFCLSMFFHHEDGRKTYALGILCLKVDSLKSFFSRIQDAVVVFQVTLHLSACKFDL
jgi:hypothetical protein